VGARTVLPAEEHVLDVAHAVDVIESVCQGAGDGRHGHYGREQLCRPHVEKMWCVCIRYYDRGKVRGSQGVTLAVGGQVRGGGSATRIWCFVGMSTRVAVITRTGPGVAGDSI
jgi:hypothetical protein